MGDAGWYANMEGEGMQAGCSKGCAGLHLVEGVFTQKWSVGDQECHIIARPTIYLFSHAEVKLDNSNRRNIENDKKGFFSGELFFYI